MSRIDQMVDEIKELIVTRKEYALVASNALLDTILKMKDSEKYQSLRIACELFAETVFAHAADEKNENHKDFTNFSKQNGKLINSLISVLVSDSLQKSIQPEEFYKALWDKVISNPIFENTKIYYVFFEVISNELIPYFNVKLADGILMEDDIYISVQKKISQDINRILFILALDFEQKTQEASLILDEILSHDSFEERTVLLARLISRTRSASIDDIFERLKQ